MPQKFNRIAGVLLCEISIKCRVRSRKCADHTADAAERLFHEHASALKLGL